MDNTILVVEDDPELNDVVLDVLEGTRWAFRVRDEKYGVAEHRVA